GRARPEDVTLRRRDLGRSRRHAELASAPHFGGALPGRHRPLTGPADRGGHERPRQGRRGGGRGQGACERGSADARPAPSRPPANGGQASAGGSHAWRQEPVGHRATADLETAADRGTTRYRGAAADREIAADSASPPPWPGLPGHDDMPSSGCPPGRPGRVTLTVRWQTLAGMSAEPGTVCWLGPVTPQVSRQIAEAGADDPRTEWRVIVTSSSGEFICVARIRKPRRSRVGSADTAAGESCGPRRSVGLIDRVTVTIPADLLDRGPQLAISVQGEDTAYTEAARRGTALGDMAQRDV